MPGINKGKVWREVEVKGYIGTLLSANFFCNPETAQKNGEH